MMWIMKPNARTGTITVTIGSDINSHPNAKSPSGSPNVPLTESITEKRLMLMCKRRKIIRNSPLTLIMSFLPIEDVKMLAISFYL